MYSSSNRARERIPIHKAEGITPTEKYLNSLCERTFLSLWSYPGVFRNQKVGAIGDGKELCDMLVIFGKHVLIFSDKHCSFPSSGDLKLNWKRWYKRAIAKSADQAWGAERWLKSYPEKFYLDRACTNQFPFDIPSPEIAKYHLIVVAHGSEEKCIEYYGGSGSLMLVSALGDVNKDDLSSLPFVIGDLDRSKTFIHVLTETTLDILLQTLDTISDFVGYLDKKVQFIRNMMSVNVPGEEELLAFYLQRINSNGEHDFVIDKKINVFALEEGFWEDFYNSPQRQKQLKHNEISYAWDNLIERFSDHALKATQYYTNQLELTGLEIGLRFMASEPRTRRRMIMKSIYEMFTKTPDGQSHIKVSKPKYTGSPYYVFLCLSNSNFKIMINT